MNAVSLQCHEEASTCSMTPNKISTPTVSLMADEVADV